MIKIAPDKRKHFFVGIPMGAVLQLAALYMMPQHFLLSIIVTFITVVGISYGFELFSLITKKGHYEVLDAVAAILGGVIGMAIILVLQ
jgi:glycopeptide antibiotics resistance protein